MLFIVVILLGQSESEAMRKKMMTSVNINYVKEKTHITLP